MSDDLRHVRSGEPLRIPAGAYNAFVDAARAHRKDGMPLTPRSSPAASDANVVLVKNTTSDVWPQYGLVALQSPIVLPAHGEQEFRRRVAMRAGKPTNSTRPDRLAVLLTPLTAGRIGRAAVGGAWPVRATFEVDGATLAEPDTDASGVGIARGGAGHLAVLEVLWKEPGTGERWAVVRLRTPPEVRLVYVFDASGTAANANWTYRLRFGPSTHADALAEGVGVLHRQTGETEAAPNGSPALAIRYENEWWLLAGTTGERLVTGGCD